MTEELKTFLIILGLIAAVLLILAVFFRNTALVRKLMGLFIEELDDENSRVSRREETQKSSNEPIVEMAKLVRKSDDRLRVYESDGSMHIVDEYFELEFLTRKGKKLKIACSDNDSITVNAPEISGNIIVSRSDRQTLVLDVDLLIQGKRINTQIPIDNGKDNRMHS